MNNIALSFLVKLKFNYLKRCISKIKDMEQKILLGKLFSKSEHDLLFKNQKIIFRMRLQGQVFPILVYKVIITSRVIEIAPMRSTSGNSWRELDLRVFKVKAHSTKSKSTHVAHAVHSKSSPVPVKHVFLQMNSDLELDHYCVGNDVDLDDLL